MPSAYHMVHYRLFSVPQTTKSAPTLEAMCRSALNKADTVGSALWARVSDRIYQLPSPDNKQIVLNKVADLSSAVFGEMCLIEDKGFQALLELKASNVELSNLTVAQIYELSERSAPTGSQFIRGMVYWLAISNHLFFVRLQGMGTNHIVSYLEWLLKEELLKVGDKSSVSLQAEFDKSSAIEDIGDIRRLRVSGKTFPQLRLAPVVTGKDEDETREIKTVRTIADRLVQFAQAIPITEALFGKQETASLVESLGPKEYLSVDASVKIKGQRTEKSRSKLRELASGLADITDGEIQVEGKDGKLSDGDAILRTRMPFEFSYEGSNYLDFDNVADQIQEVYSRFVLDGKIKA